MTQLSHKEYIQAKETEGYLSKKAVDNQLTRITHCIKLWPGETHY